jgi:N-acetylglucosaminyl-diphospho-decaprenol L-rhamnosyltransferase
MGLANEVAKHRTGTKDAASGLRTTAVIVHWGTLRQTVTLARELCDRIGIDEVLVVSNDLQPRPPDLARAAHWLIPSRNLGFAGGFEHAYRVRPGADCYLLLNSDVHLDEACIAECQQVLSDPTVGVVAPVLVNSAGLQSGVGRLSRPLFVGHLLNYPTSERVCDAEWVTGAVMFIRASCYEHVGFNLSYFLIWEDVDFCYRVRANGWRVAIASRALAWHQGGANRATLPAAVGAYYGARNRIWFSRRWGSRSEACLVWLWVAAIITPRTFLADCVKRRSFDRTRSALHALADSLIALPSSTAQLPCEPRPARWIPWPSEQP